MLIELDRLFNDFAKLRENALGIRAMAPAVKELRTVVFPAKWHGGQVR